MRAAIAAHGPMPLSQFMGESNALYYASRDPLGEEGDFITAPEISQVFGELIGLWLADVAARSGAIRPDSGGAGAGAAAQAKLHYVELGPGRGTLARDALRAAARFGLRPQVHFVEASPALRALQAGAVPGARHHHDLSTLPEDGPLLVLANEFFDALPIRQLVRTQAGWRERMVGIEGEGLAFLAGAVPMDAAIAALPAGLRRAAEDAAPGTVIETSPAAAAVMGELARRLAQQGGAGLIIDYGHLAFRTGSTLQALARHRRCDPLAAPGEADLTAHVDFAMLGAIASRAGALVSGVIEQGCWLAAMGAGARFAALARQAPQMAPRLERQRARLMDADQMGRLFKVMGLAGRGWADGAGFAWAQAG